jgi:hypothetical protein
VRATDQEREQSGGLGLDVAKAPQAIRFGRSSAARGGKDLIGDRAPLETHAEPYAPEISAP